MRTWIFTVLAGMSILPLACGLSINEQEPQEGGSVIPTVVSEMHSVTVAPAVDRKTPTDTASPVVGPKTPTDTETSPVETNTSASTVPPSAATETPTDSEAPSLLTNTPIGTPAPLSLAPPGYDGPTSLEERIFASPVIARVRLDSTATTVESATIYDGSTKYIPLLEFSFSVEEYLKGSGADDIVAVWATAPFFDTQEEAANALPAIVAARDAQWDDHEAILFLQENSRGFLSSTELADRFYLAWGGSRPMYSHDDKYSISSRRNRLWLPAAAVGEASQATGDQQRFLTDVPPDAGTASTITLGEIKTRIAAITAKLSASDGSEEYTECVQLTYQYARQESHYRATYSSRSGSTSVDDPPPNHELNSGLAAGTSLYEDDMGFGPSADELVRFWLDGGDANLFSVAYGDAVPYDYSGDGADDSVNFTRRVVSARPLPEGVNRFHFNIRSPFFKLCDGYATRYEWTVTVAAPTGTLHEAFFDPATVGTAVAADDSNGVLKPASLTDANGTSATLERIAWEPGTGDSGTVKVEVNPNNALTGQLLDFIELDGTVPLSLNAADATVDNMNDTLSWAVESQPWHDGDLLTARIRRAPASCSNGVVVTNPGSASGLVQDCETLLWVKDLLVGTGTLNWSADTAISSWDGITLSGSPQRVTGLALASRSLNGTIPARLATLTMLTSLDLASNQLIGRIPSQLGSLAHLTWLRLAGNSFSGCIPATLRNVSDHDLDGLELKDCITKAPVPQGLGVFLDDETFSMSWSAISGEVTYQLQARTGGEEGEWADLAEIAETTQTYSPEGGLLCETTYDFRVRARGDGTSYTREWSEPSQVVSLTTGMCNQSPMFLRPIVSQYPETQPQAALLEPSQSQTRTRETRSVTPSTRATKTANSR